MTDHENIICNQIAIMEALVVLMCQEDKELPPMNKTWQFDHLKRRIKESQAIG